MAKSLRSKRARKMRAIKRIRYGEKELVRLQNMIKKAEENGESSDTNAGFKLVSPPSSSSAIVTAVKGEGTEVMDVETRVVDPKTMKDQLGNYAPWINQKRIKRMQRSRKRQAKKKKKQSK